MMPDQRMCCGTSAADYSGAGRTMSLTGGVSWTDGHIPPPAGGDTTPPSGTVTIAGGAALTKTATVSLTLAATDNSGTVSQMRFSNDNATYSAWEAYATSRAGWPLTTGDGTKTVWAQFKDAAGNLSATANDTITLDTMAPTVSNISHGTPGATSATITWTTNDSANAFVDYGLTTAYGSTATSAAFELSHSVSLGGLAAGQTYYYRVRSQDPAGNEASVGNRTFATAAGGATTTVTFQRNVAPTSSYTAMSENVVPPTATTTSPWNFTDVIYFNYNPAGSRLVSYFDVSTIPAGATITQAKLAYNFYNGAGINAPINLYRVRTNWLGGVSWSVTGGDWADKNGAAQGTVPFASVPANVNGWYEWDITPLVQGWVTGTWPNYGVLLKLDVSTTNYGQAYGSAHGSTSVHPKLTVTYSSAPGPAITSFTVSPNTRPYVNKPVTLSVAATGSPPLQYQFLKDGAVLCSWSTSATCAWTAATGDVGLRSVKAQVKDAVTTTPTEQTKNVLVIREPLRPQ
jgi:hypothetical protein